MTIFSVHKVCKKQTNGTCVHSSPLMPFESFLILIVRKKSTTTVTQCLLNHSILLTDTQKSWAGKAEGLLSSLTYAPTASYTEYAGSFFSSIPPGPTGQGKPEDRTLQSPQHSISTWSQMLCTSRIMTLLQHFTMPFTRNHKQMWRTKTAH